MKKLYLFTLSLLMFSVVNINASAQTTMDLSTIDLGIQQIQENTFLYDSINRDMAMSSSVRSNTPAIRGKANTGRTGSVQTSAGATTFRPVAVSIMPQRLASQVAKTSADSHKLERMFAGLLGDYQELLRRHGGPTNDVARAASYLISQCSYVYNDGQTLTDGEFAALRDQMQRLFAADEKFRLRNDRERQQMYEGYAITGEFLGLGYLLMKQRGDEQTLKELRQLARRNLEGMLGVSPERIKFTNNGIQFR